MLCQQTFTDGSWNIRTTSVNGVPYFCGKDVAQALGYKNLQQSIRTHVPEEDRLTLDSVGVLVIGTHQYNVKHLVWLTEAGVYALIWCSKKEEAKLFKQFVCQTIIPWFRNAIRDQTKAPLCLHNETDLHYKVVQAIRRFFTHALLAPGLGELQDSSDKRIDAFKKGYQAGQPDILVLNCHGKYNGMALELKRPDGKGKLSEKQCNSLIRYESAGFKTMVSDDYDAILLELFRYFQDTRLQCPHCPKRFKTEKSLDKHLGCFHRLCY